MDLVGAAVILEGPGVLHLKLMQLNVGTSSFLTALHVLPLFLV